MAFPILGTPRPQFSDSTGVLASGTVSILDPTTSLDATYYPTADDADAGTNPQTGDITLNANGYTPDGVFGPDNETYKVVVKDSDGNTVWSETDVRIPSREPHYDETAQTLTDSGAVSLTTPITHVVTTGAASLTLADGTEGQRKFIVMKTDAGAATLTPTSFANGTEIIFANVGETADMIFTNGFWCWLGGTAAKNPGRKVKTADTDRASTTTLADDPHLSGFAMTSGRLYRLRAVLLIDPGSDVGDLKWAFEFSSAPTSAVASYDTISYAASVSEDVSNMTATNTLDMSSGDNTILKIEGLIDSAGGTMDFQWAQNATSAFNTTLKKGSWMELEQL